MKITTKQLSPGLAFLLTPTVLAEIVYQDTFDAADGIAINEDTGGGLVSGTNITAADPFDDASGDAVAQNDFGNRLTWAHTANQFPLSAGFTLNVIFTTAATGFPSFTSSFGIVDEVTPTPPDASGVGASGNLNAFMTTDQPDLNAVGFSATTRLDMQGLNADLGTLSSISTDLNAAIVLGTTQIFSLTVNADGSATFSLDEVSGSLPAETLSSLFTDSADGAFHFVAYSQGNTGLSLNSVTIDAEPVPSTGLAITEFIYMPEADAVTLTWVSNPDEVYIARFSTDLIDWTVDLADGITMALDDENSDDDNLLTATFSLAEASVEDLTKLFFRVEIEDQ